MFTDVLPPGKLSLRVSFALPPSLLYYKLTSRSLCHTNSFSHVRESEGPALYTCAIVSLHWATTSRREDACVLTWSSRSGGKKRYVPSDVIKAKIYLFSLCIHGEIVSTGSKLMYYCTNMRGAGCLRPFLGVLNGMSLSCCTAGFEQI